jgi:arsenate reductase (thioredoxin)
VARAISVSPVIAERHLTCFEGYLSVWVTACMLAGVALGKLVPTMVQANRGLEFGRSSQINVPIARADLGGRKPAGLTVTWFVNWLVKPLSMALLARLFFRFVFSGFRGGKVDMAKQKILIVCTANSARSQMAEGLLRHERGDRFEVFSAGTKPTGVRQEAIAVMDEIGLDISDHRFTPVNEFIGQPLGFVITVCNSAKEVCPVFTGDVKRLHWPFDDPAAVEGPSEVRNAAVRRIRDQIHGRIMVFLDGNESVK